MKPAADNKVLLYIDIAGSTPSSPNSMGQVTTHLRSMLSSQGGDVFFERDLAICAAFANSYNAAQAAVAVRSALEKIEWPTIGRASARMGIDAGRIKMEIGGYSGAALSGAVRLANMAKRGEILVSNVVAKGASDEAEAISLEPLEWASRGASESARIYQVASSNLRPKRRKQPGNIPTPTDSFFGRQLELYHVESLLAANSIVTIVGARGIGKSRLAIEVGLRLSTVFNDGVWFLAFPYHENQSVFASLASSMRLGSGGRALTSQALATMLRRQNRLLILDDGPLQEVEVAQLAIDIVRSAPRTKLLITGERPLGLRGEQVVTLERLSVPSSDTVPLEEVLSSDAVRLFEQSVRKGHAEFAVGAHNAQQVAAICRRLGGTPRALEAAAASWPIVDGVLQVPLDEGLVEAQQAPTLPTQGPGPHFALAEGKIRFAKPPPVEEHGNNVAQLRALHPLLRGASDQLATLLGHGNKPHPHLAKVAHEYHALVDQNLEAIPFAQLFAVGLRLENAAAAARREIEGRLAPSLEDPEEEVLASVVALHGPFILASREGRELIEASERYARQPEEEKRLRDAVLKLSEVLAGRPDIIEPRAARFLRDTVTASESTSVHPARAITAATATTKNVLVVLMAGGFICAAPALGLLIGGPIGLGIGAAVSLVTTEGLKKTEVFEKVRTKITTEVDRVAQLNLAHFFEFVLQNEDILRNIAGRRPHFQWLHSSLDWLKRRKL